MTMLLSKQVNYDKLPESRKAVLEFVRTFMDEHGYAPTIREIGAGTGIT